MRVRMVQVNLRALLQLAVVAIILYQVCQPAYTLSAYRQLLIPHEGRIVFCDNAPFMRWAVKAGSVVISVHT